MDSKRHRKTHRKTPIRGGLRPDIKQIMDAAKLTPNLTVNPNSKFIVATYWWGNGNMNKNTQIPCLGDTQQEYKNELTRELLTDDEEFRAMKEEMDRTRKLANATPSDTALAQQAKQARTEYRGYLAAYFEKPEIKKLVNEMGNKIFADRRAKGEGRDPITFDAMMVKFEERCKKMNCNYLVANYPFSGEAIVNGQKVNQYQYAINAKPYFIKKALEVSQGRGVLYIDGDMFVNKYPHLFDIENVDCMMRGWNMDARAGEGYSEGPVCFDPYIFETSGGTMFFGNTPLSHMMLDQWVTEASKPIHDKKADDRVLSMLFVKNNWAARCSMIQLPIEYLWLTNDYDNYYDLKDEVDPCDIIIEHPACLTSEDTATQGAASSDRNPVGYDALVYKNQDCDRPGGTFYEYIFFPTERMVSTFAPYIRFISTTKNAAGENIYTVVPFAQQYGKYNNIAKANMEKAATERLTASEDSVIQLPQNAPIPTILAHLQAGHDVQVGTDARPLTAGTDCRAKNVAPTENGMITLIQLNTSAPIYFNSKSQVLVHLVAMCSKLSDINVIIKNSYMFVSRIRWDLT
jgi:hypothetical protein